MLSSTTVLFRATVETNASLVLCATSSSSLFISLAASLLIPKFLAVPDVKVSNFLNTDVSCTTAKVIIVAGSVKFVLKSFPNSVSIIPKVFQRVGSFPPSETDFVISSCSFLALAANPPIPGILLSPSASL